MKCFTCSCPLHQTGLDGHEDESFATCFDGKRICEQCEAEFERKTLPKRAVGMLAAEWRGYSTSRIANTRIKTLTTRVRTAKNSFVDGNFSFTPADML